MPYQESSASNFSFLRSSKYNEYCSFLHIGQIPNSVPLLILPDFMPLPSKSLSYLCHISVSFFRSFVADSGTALTSSSPSYLLPYFTCQYPQIFYLLFFFAIFYHFPFFSPNVPHTQVVLTPFAHSLPIYSAYLLVDVSMLHVLDLMCHPQSQSIFNNYNIVSFLYFPPNSLTQTPLAALPGTPVSRLQNCS